MTKNKNKKKTKKQPTQSTHHAIMSLRHSYFLFIVILNWLPIIQAFQREIAMIPLVFVLAVTAIKDAWEDYRRARSDKDINNRNWSVALSVWSLPVAFTCSFTYDGADMAVLCSTRETSGSRRDGSTCMLATWSNCSATTLSRPTCSSSPQRVCRQIACHAAKFR